MTHLELHLRVMGVIMLLLVAMNLHIPRRFGWKQEMAGLSLLNRQIFQVHAAFICIILALFAALLLTLTSELLEPTRLARGILAGMAGFWFCRMLCQWFVYDSRIWRGDRLLTAMHVIFSGVWVYFVATLGAALWHSLPPPPLRDHAGRVADRRTVAWIVSSSRRRTSGSRGRSRKSSSRYAPASS